MIILFIFGLKHAENHLKRGILLLLKEDITSKSYLFKYRKASKNCKTRHIG